MNSRSHSNALFATGITLMILGAFSAGYIGALSHTGTAQQRVPYTLDMVITTDNWYHWIW